MRGSLAPLAERQFRLLFLGRTVSIVGNAFATTAIAFAVLDVTGSKADLGYVLAARSLPQVVFILAGGVWADACRATRHGGLEPRERREPGGAGRVASLRLGPPRRAARRRRGERNELGLLLPGFDRDRPADRSYADPPARQRAAPPGPST